jgi:hypothetical protein
MKEPSSLFFRIPGILVVMIVASLLVLSQSPSPSITELDNLAQARNVEGLSRFLEESRTSGHNPFNIVRTNGAYEVGRFGWHALRLTGVGGEEFVVFSTPLTSEDTGELVFLRVGDKLRFVPETQGFGIRLVRHQFDLQFVTADKRAVLVDQMKLANLSGEKGGFLFRMSPQYIVSKISDRAGKAVPFAEAGGVVSTTKPTGEDVYTISYSAKVDLPNYAGSISSKEATLTNDYWYPMVARQPVPYDLTIHAPASWTAIGQGDLVEDRVIGSEHLFRYQMNLPCVYYSVSVAPYDHFTQEIHGKRYSCWSSLLSKDQMEEQTEFYAPIIEFYQRFAPFPFKGYGAVDSAVYGGGALEAYSFTTWGHGSLPTEDAHEPSHTWWGGIINNSYLGSFWNESFAVFSEGLYRRNVTIGNSKERSLAFIQDGSGNDSYNSAALAQSGADIGGVAGGLGYGKGSQVLQMLEQLLGTDQMVATMQEWIKKSQGTTSDWADYEEVVTRLNPERDIKGFFDDWIRKPGYADLIVDGVQYTNGRVLLNVAFRGSSYRLPLDVMLQYEDGSRAFKTIDISKPGKFEIASDRKPILLSVDPWRRALRKINSDEEPIELNRLTGAYPRFTDSAHTDYLARIQGKSQMTGSPTELAGSFIVGHPSTMPVMEKLCQMVGFKVSGNNLTYDGTTIDLNNGCALAVVDLGEGKNCVIGLGKTRVAPDLGRARLALTDNLGRFLRGKTDPKTSGFLTFKL